MWKTFSKIRKSWELCTRFHDLKKINSSKLTIFPKLEFNSKNWLECTSKFSGDGKKHQQWSKQQASYFQLQYDWLDAIGWSGIVLLGWYIVHPYRNPSSSRYQDRTNSLNQQNNSLTYNHWKLVQHVTKLVICSATHNVVPAVRAVNTTIKVSESQFEEHLREGCNRMKRAHEIVSSALVNFLGTECMQNGQHAEAFIHFTEAAKYENSAAMFNLGICYEMGLGTSQSFQKAAGLYKKASDLGHATAMYNLGVFHVHGWGNVEIDADAARNLFIAAAKLGQPDALSALKVTDNDADENSDDCPTYDGVYKDTPEYNDATEFWFKSLNIKFHETQDNYEEDRDFSSIDSGVNVTSIN